MGELDALLMRPVDAETDDIGFSYGNPRVEHVTGIIRLYREIPRGGVDDSEASASNNLPPARGTDLCVRAMPGNMGIADFFQAVKPYLRHIRHARVLR